MTTRKQPAADRARVLLIAGAVAAVVVIIGVAIAFGPGSDDGAGDVASGAGFGPVVVEGAALPSFSSTSDDAAAGMLAPRIEGVDADGEPITVGGGTDTQPTMVVFLAHWCPHCQRELPVIVELMASGDLDGLRVIAVLTGTSADRPNFPPQPWLVREGWTGEVLLDDEKTTAATDFGLSGYPYLVFLDAEGKVVARSSGELPASDINALADLARTGG
ncbi:MAG: TlpA disulfide reductase family protein [Acidimicrobiales bacterium]